MSTTAFGKTTMLQSITPAGVDMHFALFSNKKCTLEIDIPRVAYTGWSTDVDGNVRTNTAAISWDAAVDEVVVRGCGWYDAAVGGNLLAFGDVAAFLNPDEDEITLETGDIAEIDIGGLQITVEDL